MLLNILRQFNWVDIFVIIILIRTCYIATKNGFAVELFKISGTILAIYLSFHYYSNLADVIKQRFIGEKIPLEFLDFLCFGFLAILGYIILVLFRQTFSRFIKMEAVPQLDKWGGFFIGLIRGILLSSLVIFALLISSFAYFRNSANDAYLGGRIFKIAPATYGKIWFSFASKFMPQEKFNLTIQEVGQDLTK